MYSTRRGWVAVLQALDSGSGVRMYEWLYLGKARGRRVIHERVCIIFKSLCVWHSVRCSGGWLSLDPPLGVLIWILIMDFAECKFL